MRLAVYGNIVRDEIFYVDGLKVGEANTVTQVVYKLGGVANFCRALPTTATSFLSVNTSTGKADYGLSMEIDELLASKKCPFHISMHVSRETPNTQTSRATILVDRLASQRTGLVQWGACTHKREWKPSPVEVDWHHLMYLDKMSITAEELSKFNGIISADYSDSTKVIGDERLKHVDYLIVADQPVQQRYDIELGFQRPQSFFYIAKNELAVAEICLDLPVKRGIVVHTPGWCAYLDVLSKEFKQHDYEIKRGLNVLGAGDYFAARCVANLWETKGLDLQAVHEETVSLLLRQ